MYSSEFAKLYTSICPEASVLLDAPMKEVTSFRTGGPADMLVSPSCERELIEALRLCRETDTPCTVLGSCTNVLVRDGGIRGAVIRLGEAFSGIKRTDSGVWSMAGTKYMALSRESIAMGFKGLAFASGIPGSVGGAVFMNAGAYGGETKDVVRSVTYLDTDTLELVTRDVKASDFGYRTSVFQSLNCVITGASFELQRSEDESERALADELLARRRARQPVHLPSAGSVFKRPEGYFAGALIEQSGMKGASEGAAQVSPMHAGFIVNNGGASSADVLRLIDRVKEAVFASSGVTLECEVRIIGEG